MPRDSLKTDLFICLPKSERRLLPFYYAKRVSFLSAINRIHTVFSEQLYVIAGSHSIHPCYLFTVALMNRKQWAQSAHVGPIIIVVQNKHSLRNPSVRLTVKYKKTALC